VEIDPAAGIVSADAARLQQVFWNVLTNALKFTDQGGRVTATARRLGEHDIEVAVTDTGSGIPPEFLPFVFEPFRQADARPGRRHGGLGLGLAISRQLVELHGGTIRAASDGAGQGSTFTIRLPQSAAAAEASPPPSRGDDRTPSPMLGDSPLSGVDILLVDDEEDTLTMFRESLEAAGASVRAVTTAADAMREYDQRPPDLVVTDLVLPGTDGFELLRLIREKNPGIPAVAVTGYARLDDRARALGAGFQAHFAKPVHPSAFVRALAAAVLRPE
jgi:CheY-like chemotaxis protein